MDRGDWDARYAAAQLVWGRGPNRFVEEAFASAAPGGRALDLACGEGRNAIFLAARGWTVTALDFSAVAIERARSLAREAGVAVDFRVDDVVVRRPEYGAYDLVLIAYLQLPMAAFGRVLDHAATALRVRGELFMIGHALRNLREGSGGPRDARVLWDPDGVAGMLEELGFDVRRCEEVLRPVAEPPGSAPAIDLLVRARRR